MMLRCFVVHREPNDLEQFLGWISFNNILDLRLLINTIRHNIYVANCMLHRLKTMHRTRHSLNYGLMARYSG